MFKKINNENGIALITALLVLSILTLLGLLATLTSSTDIKIAGNEKIATQGQYASEAGIEHMQAFLNKTTNLEPSPGPVWGVSTYASAPFQNWRPRVKRTIMDGANTFFSYSATVSYKAVPYGRKYAGKVAFYNQSSGYTAAPSGGGGWPVYVIASVARSGNYLSQRNILEVTKSSYKFSVSGAFSAGGSVTLAGNPSIDGNCYPATGAEFDPSNKIPCNCADPSLQTPKPNIYTTGTYTQSGGAADFGTVSGAVSVAQSQPALPSTPWAAMGLKRDSSDTTTVVAAEVENGPYFVDIFSGYPAVRAPFANGLTGKQYYTSSSSNSNITGNGLLVIHNPNFDLTNPAIAACANFSGACPCCTANAPAVLDANGGTFNGMIIADEIQLRGNVEINGAVISLTVLNTQAVGAGNPQITFSCAAIEQFASGKINQKLNWHKE